MLIKDCKNCKPKMCSSSMGAAAALGWLLPSFIVGLAVTIIVAVLVAMSVAAVCL